MPTSMLQHPALSAAILLIGSNLFMTFAWYGHLGPLKIMQEIITLAVFVPFAMFYMDQPLKLDYLRAALRMVGAAYFIFGA